MINPMDLTGKKILVTGASSGLGKATAVGLSRLGAKLTLVARDETRLKSVYSELESDGHRWISFDLIRDFEKIPQLIKKDALERGPYFGLVHSAGIEKTLPVRAVSSQDYDELMDINTKSAFFLAKGFCQKKCFVPGGGIVFIASVASIVGQGGRSLYCLSKGALVAMMKSMAVELSSKRIRVNTVSPGQIETEMISSVKSKMLPDQYDAIIKEHPLGLGQPDDVAYAVSFLLAETGKWITGTNLVVDGGYTAK
jgi:NAD(P)-dependent dehydrogenase (short-subunit alcohol dehydrogenase family)